MKTIVCLKAVQPHLVFPDNTDNEPVMNPYDMYALKNVLQHKVIGQDEVICLSMGAKSAENIMLKCMAMGADNSILLSDAAFGGADTVATTYTLEQAVKKIGDFQLIVCGGKSVDGETGQVVYGLAQRLGIPCVANVLEIIERKDDSIIVKKEEEDQVAVMECHFPVVIAFQEFTTERENISLLKLKRAKKTGITTWNSTDMDLDVEKCGSKGSKTKVLNVESELLKSKENQFIEGEVTEQAEEIYLILRKKMGNE